MFAQSIFLGVIGGWQVVVIVVLALLFFGGKKIPELMRGLGGGIREFKGAMRELIASTTIVLIEIFFLFYIKKY